MLEKSKIFEKGKDTPLEPVEGCYNIKEQTEYEVELLDVDLEGLKKKLAGSPFKEVFRLVRKSGIINYKNFVGKSRLFGLNFNVESKKIDMELFNKLLKEITEIIASLPYDFNSPTFLPFERIEDWNEDILYHNFVYIRYIMLQIEEYQRLESLINRILCNPHRKMERESEYRDISLANNIDNVTLQRIFSNPEYMGLLERNSPLNRTPLAQTLGKSPDGRFYFPEKVFDRKIIITLDTPENRFIKYFLCSCRDIVRFFYEKVIKEPENYISAEIEDDYKLMSEKLNYLLNHNFFQEVGDLEYIPISSSILQKQEGYRDVLYHFARLNLATNYPIENKDLKRILENKDIATLYEYWTYFKVVETLKEKKGNPDKALQAKYDEKKAVLHKGCITWEIDPIIKLYYDKAYSTEQSYSLPLRPDITLEIGPKKYIFDAKFKLDKIKFESDTKELDKEESEESSSFTFVKGDIYKMHAYKDAIEGAMTACILYPGDKFIFYEKKFGSPIKSSVEEIEVLEGVGAIPLKLGNEEHIEILKKFISKILDNFSNNSKTKE